MNIANPLPSSPLTMRASDTALLVVDVQEKLVRLIPQHQRLVWNVRRLLDAAKLFGVKVLATEQYPQGLGPTTKVLAERLDAVSEKTKFSCGECADLFEGLQEQGIRKILTVGIETHVCVQQTALDLLTAGFEIYVAVDSVGSRYDIDHQTALRRMELSGAFLTTAESAMFEWCERSGSESFKSLSRLIREERPGGERPE